MRKIFIDEREKKLPEGKQQKQDLLQPRKRRQTGAAAAAKNTLPGVVQSDNTNAAAGKQIPKQALQTGDAMYRQYILPYAAKQQQSFLAHKIATGGKLPEGYRWHIAGDKAYTTKNLASKPLAIATAAGQPAVFGINPSEYVKHMQAIDAYNAAAGNSKREKRLTAARDAALSALGEEAAQYAGKDPVDYYRSYVNQAGNEETARNYMESYKAPFFQIRGSAAAKHADTMNRFRFSETHGPLNPVDLLETGDSQLLQKITEEEKNTYLSIADRYGADAATDYWDTIKKSDKHDQHAYALRDAAYRDLAREHPVPSSLLSIGTAPLGLAGAAYSLGQKLMGKEIDPYADPFMFGQATSAIRDQVGAEITQRYGNADGTDNFASWLMRMGYNAAMSGADSLLAGKLGGTLTAGHRKGAALAASLMQGTSGAGGLIQNIKLRGGTDEQALLMGGLSIVFETATEYLPMEQLLKTADLKDAASFRQLAASAFKGGLAEAPGEGLSELLGSVSDQMIMGELGNYEQNWRYYRDNGFSSIAAAKQQAVKDILWDVCEASVTGFLAGEGSNLIVGAGSRLYTPASRQPVGQHIAGRMPQAAPGIGLMPWVTLPGTPDGMMMPEALPETVANVPQGMVTEETTADASALLLQKETDGLPESSDALRDKLMPVRTEESTTPDGTIPAETDVPQLMPLARYSSQQTYYDPRAEVAKRFGERARPLVELTRELWQSIQQIEDPTRRKLGETAYEMLFQPMWEAAVREQFYIDFPHWKPDPAAARRSAQERLQWMPPGVVRKTYKVAQKENRGGRLSEGFAPGLNSGDHSRSIRSVANIQPEMTGTVAGKDELNTLYENAERHSLHADDPEAFRQGKLAVLERHGELQKSDQEVAETIDNFQKSGTIKADATISGHAGTPKHSEPNTVIDHIGKTGTVTSRSFYGIDGMKYKDIHTDAHGHPKNHPYGRHGEHAHDYEWDDTGKLKSKTTREITYAEREGSDNIL